MSVLICAVCTLLHHYTTPIHALYSRLINCFSTCCDFSLNLVKDRLVTWLLQSGKDYLLISDFHLLCCLMNAFLIHRFHQICSVLFSFLFHKFMSRSVKTNWCMYIANGSELHDGMRVDRLFMLTQTHSDSSVFSSSIGVIVWPHNTATRFRPPSATVVSAEPFSHGTGTLLCLQKEIATYRHWSCPCGETQTTSHIVESCPLTKLNGGLSRLHSADEDAVSWLTNYGKWHAYEKKKLVQTCLHWFYSTYTVRWFYMQDTITSCLYMTWLSFLFALSIYLSVINLIHFNFYHVYRLTQWWIIIV